MSFALLAFFAFAVGYCAGRADTRDLGPFRRRAHHLDSSVVALAAYCGRLQAPR